MDGELEGHSSPPRVDRSLVEALVGLTQHRRDAAGDGHTLGPADPALPPRSRRLGATSHPTGATFALYAADATEVRVALVNVAGQVTEERVLGHHRNNVWAGFLPGVLPGQRYGYRVDGPFDPASGLLHNANNLLLDPYAQAITGKPSWNLSTYAYDRNTGPDVLSTRDSAGSVCYSVVTAGDDFDWGDDAPPGIADGKRVIYETHVRGATKEHPGVPASARGTYSALGLAEMTNHLRRLGVNTVELLPVQAFLARPYLLDAGLNQYWGYDTIGFFAPEQTYAAALDPLDQVREFKAMVKSLHEAGIEVILDVVYNHTPEGDSLGPSIAFRGIDNKTYYTLNPKNLRENLDFMGCGNTVNAANPQTVKMIMDSLRYWVEEMHVDGFRFDVAPALARRQGGEFDRWSAFFAALNADPVLSQVTVIAEPWDVANNGYQVGNFPAGWGEWNARFRDNVRDFWRAQTSGVAEFATRICGSQDLYGREARGPLASVNFVTCHDGFTLRDWASYNQKHNLANQENNKDGADDNRSWNHGVEGPTSDAAINDLRARQQRNMLVTLFMSLGMPMLLGGDELGRTQNGNNNPYNQDNATSWYDWLNADKDLLAFTEKLGQLRAAQPVLQRTTFLQGRVGAGIHDRDCVWYRPDGKEMNTDDWLDSGRRTVGLLLNGEFTGERHADGTAVVGDTLLTLYHSGADDGTWTLPADWGDWELVIDSDHPAEAAGTRVIAAGNDVDMRGRSVMVLKRVVPV